MKNALFKEDTLAIQEDVSVGHLLKEHREALGIPLEIVAHNLRIGIAHLEKLEADHETLVSDVYTLGFLRIYAKFLNLNANALIQKFKKQFAPAPPSSLIFPTPPPEQGIAGMRILLWSVSVFIIIASISGYQWWKIHQEPISLKEVAPLQETPSVSVAPEPATEPATEQVPALSPISSLTEQGYIPEELSLPTPIEEEVVPPVESSSTFLKAIEKTWIDVRDREGKIIVRRLLYTGQVFELKHPKNLVLKVGNAQGIQITSGKKTLAFPGVQGVKSGISLNSSNWD